MSFSLSYVQCSKCKVQLKSGNELQGSNRPVLAPSLAKLSSAATGNVLQPAHAHIVECTAMIHSDRKGRKKVGKRNPGKLPEAVKRVAVWKEERRVPLTDSWQDIDLLQNEREKRKIRLKRSASCDLTVAYVTSFTK